MSLEEFIENFGEQFEETNVNELKPNTKFHKLDEWSSMMALSVISMIDEKYGVLMSLNDLKALSTIEDIYKAIIVRK